MPPRIYSEDILLNLNKRCDQQHCYNIEPSIWTTLSNLGIARKTRRGCRGGKGKGRKIEVHITPKPFDLKPPPSRRRYLVELPAAPVGAGQKPKKTKSLPKACLGSWNARSIKKKTASIADFIIDQKLDVLAVTESWLDGDDRDEVPLADIINTLPHFAIHHAPRVNRRGGGVCLIVHRGFNVRLNDIHIFQSFEYLDVLLSNGSSSIRLVIIYRPPPSTENKLTVKMFMTEFSQRLETLTIAPGHLLITGDMNFHLDDSSDRKATAFMDLLDSCGLCQHVHGPTHKDGHTLDVIISRSSDELISGVAILNGLPSDHKPLKCLMDVQRPAPVKVEVCSRNLRSIDLEQFKTDITSSTLGSSESKFDHLDGDPSILVDRYEHVLSSLLDSHAPMRTRTIVHRPNAPWYDDKLRSYKREKRKCERKWLKSGLEVDHQLYVQHCQEYRKQLEGAKCEYHRAQISQCDDRQLFKIVNKLSKSSSSSVLPDHSCCKDLANGFGEFFKKKVKRLLDTLDNINPPGLSVDITDSCESEFTAFREVSDEDVCQIVLKSSTKSCPLDPIPTSLLKKCLDPLLP
ncbi:uncharacterized protein [Amphiura filiformis]|uniref:uncharacterized protein n=1 Tax=Amphiura filiformis TaxID=82378 RepID=UPI003B20E876